MIQEGTVHINIPHNLPKEEAKARAFGMLPGLMDVLIDLLDEAIWSEEGQRWLACNYWSEEYLDEQEGEDGLYCQKCGQKIVGLDVMSPKGNIFQVGSCPRCDVGGA